MRITSKGQVTIPQHIREAAGFLPGTDVDFVIDDAGRVCVVEADGATRLSRGQRIVAGLRASAGSGLDTDEMMNLLRLYDEDARDPGFAGGAVTGAA